MRPRPLLALLPALALVGRARAIDTNAGTTGGSFTQLGQGSTRAMGLGRAYVALAEGSDSLTWNPAGLGVTQQKELGYSFLRYVQDVSSPFYLAYAHPMGRTVWGANAAYLTVSGFDVRDANGVPLTGTNSQVRDGFGTAGLARSFWYEKLFLGGALRLIHEDNAGNVHDSVVGDVGALLKPNSVISLGFSAQNLGTGKSNASSVARGGAAFRLGDFVTASLEASKYASDAARIGLGGEFSLPEEYLEFGAITFRVGYYTADNLGQNFENSSLKNFNLDRSTGFTFGFGVATSRAFGYGVALDYAIVPSGALGTTDQISIKVKF